MSLKELTKQNHSNAEISWFAGRMFSGQITNPEYAIYLKQQRHLCEVYVICACYLTYSFKLGLHTRQMHIAMSDE